MRVNNGFRAYDVLFIVVSQDDLADVDEKSGFLFLFFWVKGSEFAALKIQKRNGD